MSEAHALPPAGGVVGALSRGASSLFGATKAGVAVFSKPEIWAVRLAMAAGILAIYMKSGAEDGWTLPVVFSLCIGIAGLMFEASSAKNVMRSFWEGRAGGMMIWSCLWICALSYSGFQWISVAAENESAKTNLQHAALFKSQDARQGVEMAAKRVLEARSHADELHKAAWETIPLVDGQKVTDSAQAQALIAGVKANTRYWDLTDGCTKTSGPKTRKFCATYNDAKAALAWADTHPALIQNAADADKEVAAAESALANARNLAANTKTETSSDRADLRILASFFGWGGDDADSKAEQLASVLKIMAVSVFVSLGSMMIELERLRASSKPFGWTLRFKRWFCRVFLGRDPKDVRIIEHNTLQVMTDRPFAKAFAEKGKALGYGSQGVFA